MADLRTMEARLRPVLDAVTVRPGDTLIMRVDRQVTRQEADEARQFVKDRLPGVKDVLFAWADQILVYRPEAGDDD